MVPDGLEHFPEIISRFFFLEPHSDDRKTRIVSPVKYLLENKEKAPVFVVKKTAAAQNDFVPQNQPAAAAIGFAGDSDSDSDEDLGIKLFL